MSDLSDKAKLETVIEYLNDIDKIVERHGSIKAAIDDFEGEYAILMCLQQIGDTLNKIENPKYIEILPVRQAYGFRNILAHNYGSVNTKTVIDTIERNFPDLKHKITSLLNSIK